jgi:two-component system nitrate/nitrite response regulator NarL
MQVSHRLVVADPQLLFAHVLGEALRTAGHEVRAVCSTRAELAAAIRAPGPTICLTDLRLADGDVADLITHAAATHPDCRIIVLTDDARPEVLQSVLRTGASGYFQKSRGLNVLLDALARVARGEVVIEASFAAGSGARLVDSGHVRSYWDGLTNRELQCLQLMVEGKDTTAMSRELGVSRTTVRSHVQAVLHKLGVHSRLEAAALVARHGMFADGPRREGTRPHIPALPARREDGLRRMDEVATFN